MIIVRIWMSCGDPLWEENIWVVVQEFEAWNVTPPASYSAACRWDHSDRLWGERENWMIANHWYLDQLRAWISMITEILSARWQAISTVSFLYIPPFKSKFLCYLLICPLGPVAALLSLTYYGHFYIVKSRLWYGMKKWNTSWKNIYFKMTANLMLF